MAARLQATIDEIADGDLTIMDSDAEWKRDSLKYQATLPESEREVLAQGKRTLRKMYHNYAVILSRRLHEAHDEQQGIDPHPQG